MKTVIVVNGKPRAGKDTAVAFMRDVLSDSNIPTHAFSSIDPVKVMLGAHVDLSAKTEADRKLLSVVGDALQEHSSFRTFTFMKAINWFFYENDNGVFFLHMREPHLIKVMKENCEKHGMRFLRILMTSPRAENVTSNASDAGVESGHYDDVLTNDGTLADLRKECQILVVKYDLI